MACICHSKYIDAVTAVTISPDKTYIGVGYADGYIHLYDLSSPFKPARTTMALPLRQVLSGRKEGHLQGSRILHVRFVGTRHTSIVTADEHGRAFWWSLGKIIGVESNDVVRMLGSYPREPAEPSTNSSKRSTTVFAAEPLPLGEIQHVTDAFHLSALLTPHKLIIVGLRPQAKTWYRRLRDSLPGEISQDIGCAEWLPSGMTGDHGIAPSDPVLAYSWGKSIRFLCVRVESQNSPLPLAENDTQLEGMEFLETGKWDANEVVRALYWYDRRVSLIKATGLMSASYTPYHLKNIAVQCPQEGSSGQ